jgi:hypothetical protein
MLASINPLGERGRNQNYVITVTAYVVASTVGGAALGGALGFVGQPIAHPGVALVGLTMLAVAGLLCDAGFFGWRVPGPRRQVDETWLAT